MSQETEITRFSSDGKTFFFNKNRTKGDSVYLAMNALWGQGNRERLVVFENQMLPFRRKYTRSIGQILGAEFEDDPEPTCPRCNSRAPAWEPVMHPDVDGWALVCLACGDEEELESLTAVMESEQGVYESQKEAFDSE